MNGQELDPICNKLAVVIEPYNDELFSSWIFRLSLANGVEPYYLHKFVTNNLNSWRLDLDVTSNPNIIRNYANATGYSQDKIQSLLLHNPLEKLAVKNTNRTNSRWLIPLNNRSRNLTASGGIQFCSMCLAKYGYFRQNWRLATTTVCLKHMVYLKDHCPKCLRPVVLRHVYSKIRDTLNDDSIMYCANCGFNLRNAVKRRAKSNSVTHNKFNTQSIKDGFMITNNRQVSYSHLYFEVLSVLTCILFFRKTGTKLFNCVKHHLNIKYERWELVQQKMRTIENVPLNSRDTALYMAHWLLDDWPDRFINICKESKTPPSTLQMTRDYQPFWFHNTAKSLTKYGIINDLSIGMV